MQASWNRPLQNLAEKEENESKGKQKFNISLVTVQAFMFEDCYGMNEGYLLFYSRWFNVFLTADKYTKQPYVIFMAELPFDEIAHS